MSTTSCDAEAASRYPALSVGRVNPVLKTTHNGATQEYAGDDMGEDGGPFRDDVGKLSSCI